MAKRDAGSGFWWILGFILLVGMCSGSKDKPPQTELSKKIDKMVDIVERSQNNSSTDAVIYVLAAVAIPICILIALAVYWNNTRNAQRALEEKEAEAEAEARAEAWAREREAERLAFRDSDIQDSPYEYRVDRHGLETLAMRYGIAHLEKDAQGRIREKDTIRIQKHSSLGKDRYIATLPDYRDRKVVAIVEKGTETIKTFYPLSEAWFTKNREWEEIFKGNRNWTIKDIARAHVDRINSLNRNGTKG